MGLEISYNLTIHTLVFVQASPSCFISGQEQKVSILQKVKTISNRISIILNIFRIIGPASGDKKTDYRILVKVHVVCT